MLQDESHPNVYLTIDRWASNDDYQTFLAQWHEEYKLLDEKCEGLTESETLVGKWNLK